MKKTLILLALLTLLIMPSTLALASTDNSQAIADTVTANSNVKSAKVLVTDDMCVVAIQPIGVVARTDYEELIASLTETIKSQYKIDNVHITRSVKAYRMIDKISSMTDDERTEAIQDMMDRIQHHHAQPMPKLESNG